MDLSTLKNTDRKEGNARRVGRGPGCKRGKTCGRGIKGQKSRAGYKRREGQEGGQLPLFRKMPTRGFSNTRFRKEVTAINLALIEARYADGETVSEATLREKGLAPRHSPGGIKILGQGELTKKVTIEAHSISKSAMEKVEKSPATFKSLKG